MYSNLSVSELCDKSLITYLVTALVLFLVTWESFSTVPFIDTVSGKSALLNKLTVSAPIVLKVNSSSKLLLVNLVLQLSILTTN